MVGILLFCDLGDFSVDACDRPAGGDKDVWDRGSWCFGSDRIGDLDSLYKLSGRLALTAMLLCAVPAPMPASAQGADNFAPITMPATAKIEIGEWPLHQADADAIEAMFRREIARVQARFGEELDFVCLGYSYGEPTAEMMERLADTGIPLVGRLACSPERNREYMSVLVGLSTVRCEPLVCTANSDISFGYVIEPGVAISAHKTLDSWSVRVNKAGDDD